MNVLPTKHFSFKLIGMSKIVITAESTFKVYTASSSLSEDFLLKNSSLNIPYTESIALFKTHLKDFKNSVSSNFLNSLSFPDDNYFIFGKSEKWLLCGIYQEDVISQLYLINNQFSEEKLHYTISDFEEIELISQVLFSLGKQHTIFIESQSHKINLSDFAEIVISLTSLKLETPLERNVFWNSEWRKGTSCGKPKKGHPEGRIIYHIQEVLQNIDALKINSETRKHLRFITLVHDSFKHQSDAYYIKTPLTHHAYLARIFAEKFTSEQTVLQIIEQHDSAYHIWRAAQKSGNWKEAKIKLFKLLENLGNGRELYYLFFCCDTQTGDKDLTPLTWFEQIAKEFNRNMELNI